MTTKVKPIPDGYSTVTTYFCVRGAADAIEYYKRAFGATEISRCAAPDGKVMHAEIKIGDTRLMLADECPEMNFNSPLTIGGTPCFLHLYVEDVDTVFKKACDAGAKVIRPVQNQFYGDRTGMITDPFGHCWNISTRIEDLTEEEINRRSEEFMKEHKK